MAVHTSTRACLAPHFLWALRARKKSPSACSSLGAAHGALLETVRRSSSGCGLGLDSVLLRREAGRSYSRLHWRTCNLASDRSCHDQAVTRLPGSAAARRGWLGASRGSPPRLCHMAGVFWNPPGRGARCWVGGGRGGWRRRRVGGAGPGSDGGAADVAGAPGGRHHPRPPLLLLRRVPGGFSMNTSRLLQSMCFQGLCSSMLKAVLSPTSQSWVGMLHQKLLSSIRICSALQDYGVALRETPKLKQAAPGTLRHRSR